MTQILVIQGEGENKVTQVFSITYSKSVNSLSVMDDECYIVRRKRVLKQKSCHSVDWSNK